MTPDAIQASSNCVIVDGAEIPLREFARKIHARISDDWLICDSATLALPDGLTTISGSLDLRGYGHALPDGLTTISGWLDLRGYGHALPDGLTTIGGSLITENPIEISDLKWPVTIYACHMKIGCQIHLISEWAAMTDKQILAMDGKSALTFWRENKDKLLAVAAENGCGGTVAEAIARMRQRNLEAA